MEYLMLVYFGLAVFIFYKMTRESVDISLLDFFIALISPIFLFFVFLGVFLAALIFKMSGVVVYSRK